MFYRDKRHRRNQVMSALSLDDLVPQDHLVRQVEAALDFSFIYDLTRDLYSHSVGRPSIDPVVLFKLVFLQYLFGIRSMRQTVKEVEVNLAYRWFLGLGLTDPVPNYSTYSQNYIRRYKDSPVFEEIFSRILEQAKALGYLNPHSVFIDSTAVKANANKNKKKRIVVEDRVDRMRELLNEEIAADRKNEGKKPLRDLETWTANTETDKNKKNDNGNDSGNNINTNKTNTASHVTGRTELRERTVSTTDPESGLLCKGEHERIFGYSLHTACDANAFILGVTVTGANVHDARAFGDLYLQTTERFPCIINVVADAGYKTPAVCKQILDDHRFPILPYTRPKGNTDPLDYKAADFTYNPENDTYTCPGGQTMTYRTTNRDGRREYSAGTLVCRDCPHRLQCTRATKSPRKIERHLWASYLEKAEALRHLPQVRRIYRQRKETIERVFAEAKERHGMRYRYTGRAKVYIQALLTFACMNLKKLATWKYKAPRFKGLKGSLSAYCRAVKLTYLWITMPTLHFCA